MGWNAVAVVLLDAEGDIERDSKLGENLAVGLRRLASLREPQDVRASRHCNAIRLVSAEHADHVQVVAIGGNTGRVVSVLPFMDRKLAEQDDKTWKESILRELAVQLGFSLRRKPVKKGQK